MKDVITTAYSHGEKKNIDTDFTPFTKINSKWAKVLNVKMWKYKFQEDNIGENPEIILHTAMTS